MLALGARPGKARLHVFDVSGLSTLDDAQATALADGFEVLITVMKALATPGGEH